MRAEMLRVHVGVWAVSKATHQSPFHLFLIEDSALGLPPSRTHTHNHTKEKKARGQLLEKIPKSAGLEA